MFHELRNDGVLGRHAADVLLAHLADHLVKVLRHVRNDGQDGALRDGRKGAREHEVVGDARRGDAHVRLGHLGPALREDDAVEADDGELRAVRRVEARGADYHVDLVLVAGLVLEAVGRDGVDGLGEDGGFVADEGLEVAVARGGAAAADVEVFGDDFVDEAGVVVEFGDHVVVGELVFVLVDCKIGDAWRSDLPRWLLGTRQCF